MAKKYERQVSNKYYGAANAGKVYTNTQSNGLGKALERAGFAIGAAHSKSIDRKKDVAEGEISALYASGKTFEDINKEILAGKHSNLTGSYIDATTNYHAGRVLAAETQKNIMNNKDKYDISDKSQSLETFYSSYMPKFDGMDKSTILGFSTSFNQFKSRDAIIDANNRAVMASAVKMEEGVTILDGIPTDLIKTNLADEWKTLKTPVPSADGSGKINQLYTNKEAVGVLVHSVSKVIKLAETEADLDRADAILSANLGAGKDGQNIKSLGERNTKEVLLLKEQLLKKRRSLSIKDRVDAAQAEKDNVDALFASIYEQVPDGDSTEEIPTFRDKNHDELMDIRAKFEEMGNPAYINNFDNLVNNNRWIDTDPDVHNQLTVDIFDGKFDSQEDLVKAINELHIDPAKTASTLALFKSWESDFNKNKGNIHETNSTYKSGIKYIENAVRGNFTNQQGFLKDNGNAAIRNAHNYMVSEIYQWEKNNPNMSDADRGEFLQKLGDTVIKYYNDTVDPQLKSMTEYEQEILDANIKAEAKADLYETTGITELVPTVTKTLEDNDLQNVKAIKEAKDKFDPSFAGIPFTGEDSNFGESDKESKQNFNNANLPKVIAGILSDTGFNEAMMEAMEQQDYNSLVKQISDKLGVSFEQADEGLTIVRKRNNIK
jgi:hypothetical protein